MDMRAIFQVCGVVIILGALMVMNQRAAESPDPLPAPDKIEPVEPDPEFPPPVPDDESPVIAPLIEPANEGEFRQAIKDYPTRAVLISGDWCPACNQLKARGDIDEIRVKIPKLAIIVVDPRNSAFETVMRNIHKNEAEGNLKKFSRHSSSSLAPSFILNNVVLSGLDEINISNITKLMEK